MRRITLCLAPLLLLLSACVTPAPARVPAGPYVASGTLHLATLLPPPPAAGSPEERAELDAMLLIQQRRTPAEIGRARADANRVVWRFADALGNPPAFTAERLPLTAAFFQRLTREIDADSAGPKGVFARPRPFRAEPRLTPVVTRAVSWSYPSGHSTWAHAIAIVLADMVPERRAQIFARADEYGRNRIVAGVHYPSDVEAGKLCGTVIAADLLASPRFRVDESAAAAELRQALGPPSPAQARH